MFPHNYTLVILFINKTIALCSISLHWYSEGFLWQRHLLLGPHNSDLVIIQHQIRSPSFSKLYGGGRMRYRSETLFQLSGQAPGRRASRYVCFKMSFKKSYNQKDKKQITEDKTYSRMSQCYYSAFSSIRLNKEIITHRTQDRMGWGWWCLFHSWDNYRQASTMNLNESTQSLWNIF